LHFCKISSMIYDEELLASDIGPPPPKKKEAFALSEPKLITPLLDGHIMGDPISDHHGVRCCPAMNTGTEEKFMVKIISIPASPAQLDALLLSGAYPDAEAAGAYFRRLADETVAEAELLKNLSGLEGFTAYDRWQVVPMDGAVGYEIYLVGPYGMTLERHARRNCLTHLAAVNLGLDLCAALSVCRRNGWLYVDLQPDNILLTESKGFHICDLGFIRLSSLKYASLPDKYRSAYTAPEITDAYAALNTTMDIYAAGMVLYQVYNNGILPTPGEELLPPAHADYEMAQIILKACAQDPADRWQDPQEMSQALIGYMQRNTVNDTPIIPPVVPVAEPAPALPEETGELPDVIDEPPTEEEIPVAETGDAPVVEETEESEELPDPVVEETEETDAHPAPVVEEPEETEDQPTPAEEVDAPAPVEEETPAEEADEILIPAAEEDVPDDDIPEQFVIDGFNPDDTAPGDEDADAYPDAVLTDEVSSMLAQADELIAHQAPAPVVAPEPIDVPMPPPILPDPEPEEEEIPAEEEGAPEEDRPPEAPEDALPAPEEDENEEDELLPPPPRKKRGCIIGIIVTLLLLGILAVGACHFYENYYLQDIRDVTVEGARDYLTVTLDTDIDNTLLTVTCTDTYGNKRTASVVNGKATFNALSSGTTYKIGVLVDGFHQLTGDTSATYTTPQQTSIITFTGITGDTDGSVILNFSVQGPDSRQWQVQYTTDGEESRSVNCSAHMALVTGLTPGKTYDFKLIPAEELYIVGDDTMQFTASRVVYAQDLTISGFHDGLLVADWTLPEGTTAASWTVRCYNSNGFDATYTVTEPHIAIAGLDISQGYTLDVKADGMTVSRQTSITPNSITFREMTAYDSIPGQLTVTWTYEGTAPEGGWPLVYTINNGAPIYVTCPDAAFTLDRLVPGATYSFRFDLPADLSVFGISAQYTAPVSEPFAGYGVSTEYFQIRTCFAPDKADWTYEDLAKEDYTDRFTLGDRPGLVLRLLAEYETSKDPIRVLYIIRDAAGNLVTVDGFTETWLNLWYRGYCELDLPALPEIPGQYTLQIFFNEQHLSAEPLTFYVEAPVVAE